MKASTRKRIAKFNAAQTKDDVALYVLTWVSPSGCKYTSAPMALRNAQAERDQLAQFGLSIDADITIAA